MAPIFVSNVPNSFSALKFVGALRKMSTKACWASCVLLRAARRTARSISASTDSPSGR